MRRGPSTKPSTTPSPYIYPRPKIILGAPLKEELLPCLLARHAYARRITMASTRHDTGLRQHDGSLLRRHRVPVQPAHVGRQHELAFPHLRYESILLLMWLSCDCINIHAVLSRRACRLRLARRLEGHHDHRRGAQQRHHHPLRRGPRDQRLPRTTRHPQNITPWWTLVGRC